MRAGHELYLLNVEPAASFAFGQGHRNKTDPADALTTGWLSESVDAATENPAQLHARPRPID